MKHVYFLTAIFYFGLSQLSYAQVLNDSSIESNALMGEVQISSLNELNSEGLDFSPSYFEDGIIFTSTRLSEQSNQGWFKRKYTDLFYAALTEDGKYSNPTALPAMINSKYHDGIASFNSSMTTMYFSRNDKKPSGFGKKTIQLKIFTAQRVNDIWSTVEELPINIDKYSTCHPTVSANGMKLYFASNRPGGFGGMDIYVSEFKNNKWQEPKNMGEAVNTDKNELFPSVAKDGTLYFASNGHQGMGDLDIFMTKMVDGNWQVRNMGTPFNSWKDDFGFVMHSNQNEGFFSSNRMGGKGKDDIYAWSVVKEEPTETPMLSSVATKKEKIIYGKKIIKVIDEQSQTAIRQVKVVISEANKPGKVVRYFTDEKGVFDFNWDSSSRYFFVCSKKGYTTYNKILSPEEMAKDKDLTIYLKRDQQLFAQSQATVETPKVVEVPEVKPPVETKIDQYFLKEKEDHFTEGQLIQLDNIYYDFNQHALQKAAMQELSKVVNLLMDYPNMEIELNAHTDAVGSEIYNQNLSEKRAKSAVQYIVANGVDSKRVVAKGFGESQLLNHCGDGVNCTSEEQALNRRTEFLIKKLGSKVARNQSPSKKPNQSRTSKAIKTKSSGKARVMIRPIYYKFASADLWPAAKEELDKIADMLERHPGMKIRVASFTDVIGDSAYNLKLSIQRAKIASTYIISKGIAKERVEFKGYGETEINNHCVEGVDCSAKERRMNRRTEIQITEPGGAEMAILNEE